MTKNGYLRLCEALESEVKHLRTQVSLNLPGHGDDPMVWGAVKSLTAEISYLARQICRFEELREDLLR